MSETTLIGHDPERRDLRTRAVRDRLAELLGVPPGQGRHISRETAEAMIAPIGRDRLRPQSDLAG
jgi:hypothetical protein